MLKKLSSLKTAQLKDITLPKPNRNDPAGLLTWGYVLALGVIAVLSIGVHFIGAHISTLQENNTRISYYISQDRSYVEKIALLTSQHYSNNEELDFNLLKQTVAEMKESHQALIGMIANADFSLSTNLMLYDMYAGEKFNLAATTQEFIAQAETYTKYVSAVEHPKRTEAKDYVIKQSRALLVPLLNQALENYQTETLKLTAKFRTMQSMGTLLILVVLALEAFFIFRPLVQKIRNFNMTLMRQAMEDPLTGLSNRRAFVKQAEFELKKSQRTNTLVVVALADLDNFKSINDTYGHDAGDRVIQHFSKILGQSMRAGDVIGRIGGEEFGIVLPSTDQSAAQIILDRLCKRIAETPCQYDKHDRQKQLDYTVSIGFTTKLNSEEGTIDGLLKDADAALYEAKDQGRNRVIAHDVTKES